MHPQFHNMHTKKLLFRYRPYAALPLHRTTANVLVRGTRSSISCRVSKGILAVRYSRTLLRRVVLCWKKHCREKGVLQETVDARLQQQPSGALQDMKEKSWYI
jgi:hypothetical protein